MATSEIVDTYHMGVLSFQLLKATSDYASHPSVTIEAPKGTVILGGGAYVDWDGPDSPPNPLGNLLTGIFPNDAGTTWTATSKDHLQPSPARIVAYCIVAQTRGGTPISKDDYTIVNKTSATAPHPTQQVNLPSGFVVVGGGARANYGGGLGSLLYETRPTDGLDGWVGSAKDHLQSDPATITVWAIGLRKAFLDEAGMTVTSVNSTTSKVAHHPRHALVVPDFHLTGGGARTNWKGLGSLLTATFPQDRQTWIAQGKDHIESDPATITAWAVGFKSY
jgi:hypothetical protein